MKVVLDTNVLVSALLKRNSIPGRLLQATQVGALELVTSAAQLQELWEVLQYPKIRARLAQTACDVELFLDILPFFTTVVEISGVAVARPRDPDDEYLLATLVAGNAAWLISGDDDLLAPADQYPVLSPVEFDARFMD